MPMAHRGSMTPSDQHTVPEPGEEPAAGRLLAIWVKPARGAPLEAREEAELVAGRGMVGNAHQGGKRQVSILDIGAWATLTQELGDDLPPETRRANLLLEGVQLAGIRGRVLRIGECRLRILGQTTPCRQMDAARAGLARAMLTNWRGGSYGTVIAGGRIQVGDPVAWEEPA